MSRPRKFNEDDVLSSATDAFCVAGYAGTTVEDLMAATGLGKQSLYNAFGGKHDLFMRVFDSDVQDAVAAVDQALAESEGTPVERLRAHLLKLAIAVGTGDTMRPSLLAKATAELSRSDRAVTEGALKAFGKLEDIYYGCVVEAQQCGEVDRTADARALAEFFLTFTRGLEALGNAGVSSLKLRAAAITAVDVLPLLKPRATCAVTG
ncbi:MAG: TetR/AcrR family transcriptional regulator, transcriptional repressor for nem operon [Microbacteriaceae bacterium]|jgi:AcrR family transcriptional regulator|nr:TetR/AcrR family transcriptional regulator, transcriptional repressor for nem operon [Microbacteriaceae bacterium]